MALAAAAYVVPVAFVTQPALVLVGDAPEVALAFLRCLLAIGLMTAALSGGIVRPIGWPLRLVALVLALPNLLAFGHLLPGAVLLAALALGALCLAWLARPATAPGQGAAS